ncbi:hypothetical protein [Alicyclobacillus mengziensis]|uniref:Uncharacterized protein n=1 Tax=Alicyclobacillus mengziensis TaxID=2931921 RepID=A0A9X7Z8J8_9BACL|nr:hypothetical protein [Alicyclobacillus mengziensis]QSO48485.1 hypothetical protein JZ786_05710 [Alicyclobacillus mengziensis]
MKVIKSPIWWCTLFGLVVGYFGIPVRVPAYVMWMWNQPYGFRIASIFVLGTVGCLVGLFFHYWKWKRLDRGVSMWVLGISSLALIVGTIGFFRYQAHKETVMWTKVNLGFVRAMGVSQDNPTNTDAGIQMLKAGADIQAGADMGGIARFGRDRYQKLSSIASAFSEAGYFMVSQNKEKSQEAIKFAHKAGSIIRKIGNQSYPNETKNLNEVISEINRDIPSDFDKGWEAN